MEHDWRYNEYVQIGTDYENIEQVAEYDRRMKQVRDFVAETAEAATALQLTPEAVVWDIGTGTAEIAIGLAKWCRQIYASDISQTMLDYAVRKAEKCKVDNVTFLRGGFLGGFYPSAPIDGCISQLALHHLPDAWKMVALRRIAAALKPGGRFFLRDVIFPDRCQDYEEFFRDSVAAMEAQADESMARSYAVHIRQEYSTFSWVIEGMMQRVGLSIAECREEGFLRIYTCVKE